MRYYAYLAIASIERTIRKTATQGYERVLGMVCFYSSLMILPGMPASMRAARFLTGCQTERKASPVRSPFFGYFIRTKKVTI